MKSSRSQQKAGDDVRHDDGESTPTKTLRNSLTKDVDPSARPQLVRPATEQPPKVEQVSEDETQSEATDSGSSTGDISPRDRSDRNQEGGRSKISRTTTGGTQSPHTQQDLARLREAVMLNQHRSRPSYGSSISAKGVKRVSPIKEEGGSPSPGYGALTGLEEGVRTMSSASTESQRTVRGSMPATPAAGAPMRTPSYPFPYVPGTPRTWMSFHQPFTSLSPTVTNPVKPGEIETPGTAGTDATPISAIPAGIGAFLPPDAVTSLPPDDSRFSLPNLYDTVLQLNAEPGIEQWWVTVTNLLHDRFMAERATIVAPLDPTDTENVPWGQKATFNMAGPTDLKRDISAAEQAQALSAQAGRKRPELALREPSHEIFDDLRPQKLHPDRLRPRLESRHSYAAHGSETRGYSHTPSDQPSKSNPRPRGPQRTVTYAPGMDSGVRPNKIPGQIPTLPTPSDVESIHPSDQGPHAEVFSSFVTLQHETHPLIDAYGVSRVIRRGGVVAVTRDYAPEPDDSSSSHDAAYPAKSRKVQEVTEGTADVGYTKYKTYEEYEQPGNTEWARSPAPSPAIQADEESNPFFAADEQSVDDAFEHVTASPNDYKLHGPREAIGIDNASTVLHVPLIHPTLSATLPPSGKTPKPEGPMLHRQSTMDERKAPIAILSILSPHVPFPPSLVYSLRLLGPHLATSYATAIQFSSMRPQAVSIRHRRTASGNGVPIAPMKIEPASLENMMDVELEERLGSVTDTMTSPSDYSGRSRHSPSSILGTPGWDTTVGNWAVSRSLAGTPAAYSTHELVDSYFEAKKRTGPRSSSTTSSNIHSAPAKSTRPPTGSGPDEGQNFDEDAVASHAEHLTKTQYAMGSRERGAAREPSPSVNAAEVLSPKRPKMHSSVAHEPAQNKQHSLLHSYGADYQASFGPAVVTTPGEPRTPHGHSRKVSYSEEMPPPSERLLRTMIDSVPVQIFTAQPVTGQLSWVNSKFLTYRGGLEPRQVLGTPWDAIHAADREEFDTSWHRSLRTNQQLQQKVRLKRFDGQYRWFYVRAAPLRDRHQKVVHWIGTMMDFHEQHLAELNAARQQETAASEAKYRALANSSPQVVFAVNQVSGVTFCNSQWLHYSGQTEAQALGVGFMDHVHPDDFIKCRLPVFGEGSTQPTNVPTSLPAEPRRTLSSSANSSSGSSESDPTIMGSEATLSPVSQMPQRKLSELASVGILKVARDADGRPSYSTEVRLKSKDGVYRWHLVRVLLAASVLQAGEEEETWYGTCTDINDHKTLERDLKETMDEKSRFLSNMSHEIRTPLNGITGMVNFLIDSSLTSEQMEHVNIIRASTEGLRGLINDILDLSKAEAGMIQLNMDWLYIRALIEEVNDLTSTMAIDKGLQLNYIVDEDVPAQIKGDRFRIRQIMLNVVGNAIKFTAKGEVFIHCSLQPDVEGELARNEMFIKLEVVDTGRGFTDREAEYLFKRFSQIDGSSTRQHGGTGLGLVISRQLAQLHGGDMSAKGVPNKGSTFTFHIKTTLPSRHDQPPPPTPGGTTIPVFSTLSGQEPALPMVIRGPGLLSPPAQAKLSPKIAHELTQTPTSFIDPSSADRDSPSVSSASSDPSVRSAGRASSTRSAGSSASSYVSESIPPMKLALPPDLKHGRSSSGSSTSAQSTGSGETLKPGSPHGGGLTPPMFSILVIAPLKYSREATVQHINKTLPSNVPHQITARESLADCQRMLGGGEPVIFTHVVLVLQDVDEIVALMKQVLSISTSTILVVITDLAQRRQIQEQASSYNYEQLVADRKLCWIFKPLKPSRLGLIFDPQKEREMSTDRNQDSAQQVAVSQKQVFEELTRRLGNKDKRVLLVEDNKVNQMVILKFLSKVSIKADTVLDGVQCTEKVFANPPGHYSIILCDLHMPNKDGYQTCKEIRRWEKKHKFPHLPIIALSANVLGDVYQKCVDAGFNSYMTKPVDFKELSSVLMTFMDPSDPSKPHELMKLKRGQHGLGRGR